MRRKETADVDILKELLRREQKRQLFDKVLFDKQKEVIYDSSRLKAIQASRRASKSYTDGAYLYKVADEIPNSTVIFIGLTKETAQKIMIKDVMIPLNESLLMKCKWTFSPFICGTLPNGSKIYILGLDKDKHQAQKLLGQKFALAIIDEAGSFNQDLEEIIYSVIKPATMDYRGTVLLSGTTQNNIFSFFFKVTTGKEPGWKVFKWTGFDNPYMKDKVEEEVKELEAIRPNIRQTAWFRQMYLNEWVVDDTRLVYKYNPDVNLVKELPSTSKKWINILGIDLGFNPDPTAFVVLSYAYDHRECYIRYSYQQHKMDVTDVANKIKEIASIYPITEYVIDGATLQVVEEIKNRHNIPLVKAEKVNKFEYINLMNDEFTQGHIKVLEVPETYDLRTGWLQLTYKPGTVDEEDPGIPNHLCFIPETLVHTYNGVKKIEDVKVGDKVIDDTGKWAKVTNVLSRDYKGKILGINPVGCQDLIWCTPEHEFKATELTRSQRKNKLYNKKNTGQIEPRGEKWVAAKDLIEAKPNAKFRHGLKIASIEKEKFNLHGSTAFMLGYYVAEGSCGGDRNQISFAGHQKETSVFNILNEAIDRLPNKRSNFRGLKQHNTKFSNGRCLYFGNKKLWKHYKKLGTFTNKHFPRWVSLLKKEPAMYLLCGYLFGDGHFSKTGIKANSVSIDIIYQLSLLCNKLGLEHSINKCRRKNRYKGFSSTGLTKNDAYNINLTKNSSKYVLDFIEKNLKDCFSTKLIHNFKNIYLQSGNNWRSKYKYLKSTQEKDYSGKVFTLEVNSSGSYNVGGVIVKNCDASLYAWRHSYSYYAQVKVIDPNIHPLDREMLEHKQKLSQQLKKENRKSFFEKMESEFE